MDLRAGSPAAERRTWSRSLRGPILARPASSCAHDHDCLRLPPVLSAQNSETGKKESAGHRLNRHCRPYAEPSSNSSLGYHRNDAHTAENGFAASSGMSESAKVVIASVAHQATGGGELSVLVDRGNAVGEGECTELGGVAAEQRIGPDHDGCSQLRRCCEGRFELGFGVRVE